MNLDILPTLKPVENATYGCYDACSCTISEPKEGNDSTLLLGT